MAGVIGDDVEGIFGYSVGRFLGNFFICIYLLKYKYELFVIIYV